MSFDGEQDEVENPEQPGHADEENVFFVIQHTAHSGKRRQHQKRHVYNNNGVDDDLRSAEQQHRFTTTNVH